MLKLFVMRHAKSSWAQPGGRDFDRELNQKGLADLENISRVLKSKNYIPQKILCSPSTRTRQTLDGISKILPKSTELQFPDQLYSSGLSEYIDLIKAQSDHKSLMIIGHNPMCGALAASLPREASDYPIEAIAYRYATATVAIIEFDADEWRDIEKLQGNLVDCIIPSEI